MKESGPRQDREEVWKEILKYKKDYIDFVGERNEWDATPRYTVKELAKLIEISEHTVRYYDKEHIFPFVSRDANNIRHFSMADAFFGRAVKCLRSVGLPIEECREFVLLTLMGDITVSQRAKLMREQEEKLIHQIEELKKELRDIQYKKMFFDSVEVPIMEEIEAGTFREKGRTTLKESRIFIQKKMYEDGLIPEIKIDIV
ncbi:MerR family transcriptional regulator [Clostridium sp. MCC353]|uniref:MerR family transcriptional regulator n=1 Tax=Clostridium sp. MCC353 TaxID=2592646 RepID=UPI001C02F211|nr:MerR family transcriptional regulator [Clostridium sp. MCC353]MBT9774963.1 MerR family transcriptional regulator [Clostridium sp. MCC353]